MHMNTYYNIKCDKKILNYYERYAIFYINF
nr:MAG TPA: Chromo shadow domain protein [Caudoviricetes sp.]